MAANDVRKNFNLFVDGKGYAGQVDELNPPKLTAKMEEFRAGGMHGAIELDMGLEKLEADFTLTAYDRDVLGLFGLRAGASVPFVAREALESFDGTVTAVVHTMRGRIKQMDPGTTKAGDKPALKFALALTYYKLEHGGEVVQEVDMVNMVHVVNGVDVLADQRAALGI